MVESGAARGRGSRTGASAPDLDRCAAPESIDNGRGVERDHAKATALYRRECDAGYTRACLHLNPAGAERAARTAPPPGRR
jgi:hypothetical protein